MANIIEELVIALGFKVDSKPLQDAEKSGKDSLKRVGNESETQAKKITADWNRVGASIGKSLGSAAKAAGAAFTVALGAVVGSVKNFANEGDRIAKTAKKIGVGAEELQRLEFAAGRSGAAAEVLHQGLKKLALGMEEASTKGTGPFKEGLDALGVGVAELAGMSGEDRIGFLADKINSIQDPARRTALTMKLFGETGAELQPLLAEGSKGIAGLGREAENLGIIMSESAASDAEMLTDAISDVEKVGMALVRTIGAALSPQIQGLTKDFKGWLKENDSFIKQDLPQAFSLAADAAGNIGKAIAEIVRWIGKAQDLTDSWATSLSDVQRRITVGIGVLTGDVSVENADMLLEDRRVTSRTPPGRGDGGKAAARREALAKVQAVTDREIRNNAKIAREILSGQRADQMEQARQAAAAQARALRRKQGKGAGGKTPRLDLTQATDLFGSEIGRLAERGGVGDIAIKSALESAAKSLQEGSSQDVARSAALSKLSSLTGKDYAAKGSSDPLLSEIFGDNVPDVELSSLARGATPSTLISNITNNFSFDNDFEINDASDPMAVGESVAASIRNTFQDAIEQSTRLAKVKFER